MRRDPSASKCGQMSIVVIGSELDVEVPTPQYSMNVEIGRSVALPSIDPRPVHAANLNSQNTIVVARSENPFCRAFATN